MALLKKLRRAKKAAEVMMVVKMLTKIMISMDMLTKMMMSMNMLTKMMMIFKVFGVELIVKIFFEGEREAGRGEDPPAEHGRPP